MFYSNISYSKIVFDRIESLEAWGYLMRQYAQKFYLENKHRCPERNLKLVQITTSDDDFTEPIAESTTN
jgi:hypothetical protein